MASAIVTDDCEGGEVPVIDLSLLKAEGHHSESTYVQVRKACEEWGCFLVVNHGIKEDIIHQMDSAARDTFKLQKEIKKKNIFEGRDLGYLGSVPALPFYESLGVPRAPDPDAIQKFSDQLWPRGNPQICKIMAAYASGVEELAKNVVNIIVRSFGVGKYYTSELWGHLRMNYYPIPPNETGGMAAHCDRGFITVMYQDSTDGLQIQTKAGKWVNVKAVPNSFVVILGISTKAWSNGRIHNVVHRVKIEGCGEGSFRVSVPYFFQFPDETVIDAPAELVDDRHPRLYKPFIYGEYSEFHKARKYVQMQESENFGAEIDFTYLDIFAGIRTSV